MPYSRERSSNRRPPLKKPPTWPDIWFKGKSFKHVVFKNPLTTTPKAETKSTPPPTPTPTTTPTTEEKTQTLSLDDSPRTDLTSLLSDELLLRILSNLPDSQQNPNYSLVCKRWLTLQGRLVRSIKLLDWSFLESGRLVSRFPNLTDVDLVHAYIDSPKNSGIFLTHRLISLHLDSELSVSPFISEENLLPSDMIDKGLRILARGCPNLRKLVLISATEMGILSVAEECPTLQELELHRCTDFSVRGISACQNLQILKLVGIVDGFYSSVISDIGLTILAHGCKRLVKLELSGCEGNYDGIRAIGECCQMLEELTICDHKMDEGWMAGLSFCGNLKTLRLQSCKKIDTSPGPVEHLGSCPTLERLHLQRCQLRDKQSVTSLFVVCGFVREMVFHDCWGLNNEMFGIASICRRVKILSLEGCSSLTTKGLESVVLSWVELQSLRVVSCNSISDCEVTPALSSLFSILKELKWQPDSKSLLSLSLAGTGVGKKGGRFFKKGTSKLSTRY